MFLMMEPNFHKRQSSHFFGIRENHTQSQAMRPGRAHSAEKLQEDEKSAGILHLSDSENIFLKVLFPHCIFKNCTKKEFHKTAQVCNF